MRRLVSITSGLGWKAVTRTTRWPDSPSLITSCTRQQNHSQWRMSGLCPKPPSGFRTCFSASDSKDVAIPDLAILGPVTPPGRAAAAALLNGPHVDEDMMKDAHPEFDLQMCAPSELSRCVFNVKLHCQRALHTCLQAAACICLYSSIFCHTRLDRFYQIDEDQTTRAQPPCQL